MFKLTIKYFIIVNICYEIATVLKTIINKIIKKDYIMLGYKNK